MSCHIFENNGPFFYATKQRAVITTTFGGSSSSFSGIEVRRAKRSKISFTGAKEKDLSLQHILLQIVNQLNRHHTKEPSTQLEIIYPTKVSSYIPQCYSSVTHALTKGSHP